MDNPKKPPRKLLCKISENHMQKIKQLYLMSNTDVMSARVQNHHTMCDQNDDIIYSLEAIQQALDDLAATSAKGRPTTENRAARQVNRVAVTSLSQKKVSPDAAMSSPATNNPQSRIDETCRVGNVKRNDQSKQTRQACIPTPLTHGSNNYYQGNALGRLQTQSPLLLVPSANIQSL